MAENLSNAEHRLMTEEVGKEIARALESIAAENAASAAELDAIFRATMTLENTTAVLHSWYPRALELQGESPDRFALLERFGAMMCQAAAGKIFTVRGYTAETSGATELTAMDDLAGLGTGQLVTEASEAVTDWTDEHPIGGWWIHANALSKSDGTMNVLAIKDLDSNFDETGELAPVYSFFCGLYERVHDDGEYEYHSYATTPHAGFAPRPECVAPDGTFRHINWTPAYAGSLALGGGLTSGSGKKVYNFAAMTTGLTKARVTSAYEGLMTDCDSRLLLDMWQLRHLNKENSGIAEGCTNYNLQYQVAAAEEGVKRVLVTQAQGANFVELSSVWVGDKGDNSSVDRSNAYMRNIADMAQITHKEDVTIDGTTYTALYLDVDEAFDITATCYVSTAPWHTGITDRLPGHKDGCFHSLTAGKGPLRVMGVEVLTGAYDIGADPIYQVTAGSDANHFDYAIYEVKDSVNQAGSVTANHTLVASYTDMMKGWNYVKAFMTTVLSILFPRLVGGSSTTWYKSAFYGTSSAGVRVPWRRGALNVASNAGLACEHGDGTPSGSYWHGAPRLGGAGKKRGEWAA